MSNTRYATGGSLRQERYASDPAFNESLKASCVSRKCSILTNSIHRDLCLQLQFASMQPGGLDALVTDFLRQYADSVGSKTMRSNLDKKVYNADLVRQIRDELSTINSFLLKGELPHSISDMFPPDPYDFDELEVWKQEQRERSKEAAKRPISYPSNEFFEYCLEEAEEGLKGWLIDFCLDPNTSLADPPRWFFELEQALVDYFNSRCAELQHGKIVTAIGMDINDALDYALDQRCMVHINGVARMGKSYQVKQWCETRPGRVRYIQVPAGQDDISFFREIARALGTASGSSLKATQIKQQLEDTIQDSGLMLVFDEAHYLWPQYKSARSNPRRISWLMTAVVNKGIPVALISTPQFDTWQKAVVDGTSWASEQLEGRISYRLDLPIELPESDLKAIARHYLPNVKEDVITWLAWFGVASGKCLAGIESAATRARFLAKKRGDSVPTITDLFDAMGQVSPDMLSQLNEYWSEIAETNDPASMMHDVCEAPAKRMQTSIRHPKKDLHLPVKQLEKVH